MEYDIIIIGTTIDRITLAIYALKLGKSVLLIELDNLKEYVKKFETTKDYSLKNYVDLDRWKDEIISYGGSIKNEEIVEIKNNEVITNKEIYKTKTIALATGKRHKLLGLDNEEEFIGKGIHFCVSCDAAFYKDEIGCVIGSSDYSIENALYLSKYCKEVLIIEEYDKLNANEFLIKELFNKNNIKIYYNTKVTKIIGDRKLRKLVLNNNQTKNIDCMFIGIGFIPNIDIIEIEENKKNIFIVDNKTRKKEDEDGINVAKKIIEYLDKLK